MIMTRRCIDNGMHKKQTVNTNEDKMYQKLNCFITNLSVQMYSVCTSGFTWKLGINPGDSPMKFILLQPAKPRMALKH